VRQIPFTDRILQRRRDQNRDATRAGSTRLIHGIDDEAPARERAARNVTAELLAKRLLVSDGPRAPLRLGFPTEAVERWFPSLYPAIGS
jgi:hypothetical protein